MTGRTKKTTIFLLTLALGLIFALGGAAGPASAAKPIPTTKTLEFNPQPATPVQYNSPWAQFAVRVLKSDGTLDRRNNTTRVTIALNLTSGATGVLSSTPVTKTVTAGVATFALPGDPAISYNQPGVISLAATASDITGYKRLSNGVTVLAPFAVNSVAPADGDPMVGINTSVEVIFNKNVDPTTVNSSTFYLTPSVVGTYSVSGSGAFFRPAAPLTADTTYTATVTTGVKDTNGFPLAAAKIWSFTVLAPPYTWSSPLAISEGTGNSQPSFSADTYGNGLAVWQRYVNPNYGIFSNRAIGPGQWEGVRTVAPLSSTYVGVPTTAVGAAPMTALWTSGTYPAASLQASQYLNGSWTLSQSLGLNALGSPQLAASFGVATAVWESGITTINANRWDPVAGGFRTADPISNTTTDRVIPTDVCQNPATGDAVAVWTQSVAGTNPAVLNTMANRFVGTSWGSPVTVGSVSGMVSGATGAVACDSFGNATVAWFGKITPLSTSLAPFAASYDSVSGWQTPVQIGPETGSAYSTYLSLTADSSGVVLALWAANNGSVSNGLLLSNRYAGNAWGDPKVVHSSNAYHYYPAVAVDAGTTGGPAAAVWIESSAVFASLLQDPVNGVWGAPEMVSSSGAGSQVSVDGSGKVRVLWVQSGAIYSSERQ